MKKTALIIVAIILLLAIAYLAFFSGRSAAEPETIAREWIINHSPTYLFDGSELELVARDGNRFVFSFISSHGGYGNRTNQIVTQVITPHEMVVVVEDGMVVDAVTDGVFSETENRVIRISDMPDEESIALPVFFGRIGEGEELFPVSRRISRDEDVAIALFESLIAGPTEEEIQMGFYSMVNPETEIRSVRSQGGTLYVDFSGELQEGIAGSASVLFVRSQIERTGMRVPRITNVVISIEGETEDILQP